MATTLDSRTLDPAVDPAIDRRSRAFLEELNKDPSPFWELPGDAPRDVVTALQERTPVDLSGITVENLRIDADGRPISLYVVRPADATGRLPAFMFFHGAVWIAGNFQNHKRLVRDLVVGSQAAAVFVEYTPVPEARFPTQIDEAYDATRWVSEHGAGIGIDGSRLAVSGNSVGGNMAAAVTLMAHDRGDVDSSTSSCCGRRSTPTSRRGPTAHSARAASCRAPSWPTAGITTRRTPRLATIAMSRR